MVLAYGGIYEVVRMNDCNNTEEEVPSSDMGLIED